VSPTWATPNTLTNSQEVQTRSVAGFASATYAIVDPLKLTVGVRESNERKSGHSLLSDAAGTTPYLDAHYAHTWSSFTPQANLAYQPTTDLLAYATVATGFKSGGYDINATTIAGLQTPFNPEKVTSYEVGVKDSALNHYWTLSRPPRRLATTWLSSGSSRKKPIPTWVISYPAAGSRMARAACNASSIRPGKHWHANWWRAAHCGTVQSLPREPWYC